MQRSDLRRSLIYRPYRLFFLPFIRSFIGHALDLGRSSVGLELALHWTLVGLRRSSPVLVGHALDFGRS